MMVCAAALASCTNTEDVYVEGQSEIKLSPVTAVSTRAVTGAIDGAAYPANELFDVYAYWADVDAGATFTDGVDYLKAVPFYKEGSYWKGVQSYYWPKNGSLRFAAYSPADLDMIHTQSSDTYTLTNLVYETDITKTYEIMVAPTSPSYKATTLPENVSVVFEHALSWITIKLQSTHTADKFFTVKSVVMNDIKNQGSLTANMGAGTKTWALGAAEADVLVFNGSNDVEETAQIFEGTTTGTDGGVLVLPQTPTTLTINYTQNAINGSAILDGQSVTVPLTLGGATWEPGKHYYYTVVFDVNEILINPSVKEWTPSVVGAIETPDYE